MNPFVNPKKRSISLLPGCKNLADVLGRPQLAAKSPIRRFITLVLMQAEQDCATELVIGVEPEGGEGTAIKYKVEGCWYDMSPFPSDIRARVVSELERMAGLRRGQFPQDGVYRCPLQRQGSCGEFALGAPLQSVCSPKWMCDVRLTSPNHWLQATPGFALLLFLARRPGVPEPKRSPGKRHMP